MIARYLAVASAVLLSLGLLAESGVAAGPVSTLRTESDTLTFSIDGSPEGVWPVSPQFDPDIFLIRSRWPYQSKRVTFSSGVDSVSFDVKAGNDYDFTVVREGEPPCRVRVTALAHPASWDERWLGSVGSVAGLVQRLWYAGWSLWFISLSLCFGEWPRSRGSDVTSAELPG